MSQTTAIVMVNFLSGKILTEQASRFTAEGYHTVITDNSGEYSGPGSVIAPGVNLGFGGGCNLAVTKLPESIEWVAFVNPDIAVDHGFVKKLTQFAEDFGLDCVAPTLATPQGLIEQGYHRPTVALEALHLRRLKRSLSASSAPEEVSSVRTTKKTYQKLRASGARFGSGAFLLVRRSAFDLVNGFDERFALYAEDLDFWHRLEVAGAKLGFADHLVAHHARGAGSPTPQPDRTLLRWAGIELFVSLHKGKRWQIHRYLHNQGLRAFDASSDSKIRELVTDCWSAGYDPEETASQIRAAFLQGVMAPTTLLDAP
ncbi:MAG: glycosyltransferase family 2 protein [Acidimicrobiales bacterium]